MTALAPATPPSGEPGSLDAALVGLRDVRLPDAVSWWPLAPGWWALAALALLIGAVASVIVLRRRRSPRHAALVELARLRRAGGAELPPAELATTLGVLMRRVLLADERHRGANRGGASRGGERRGGERRGDDAEGLLVRPANGTEAVPATLHGDAWSERLASGARALPAPIARWIATAPYADARTLTTSPADANALLDACERWLRSRRP